MLHKMVAGKMTSIWNDGWQDGISWQKGFLKNGSSYVVVGKMESWWNGNWQTGSRWEKVGWQTGKLTKLWLKKLCVDEVTYWWNGSAPVFWWDGRFGYNRWRKTFFSGNCVPTKVFLNGKMKIRKNS